MQAPGRGRLGLMLPLLLLPWLAGSCCALLVPPPACPEPCDCPQRQHLLCSNRGLRAVPRPPEPQGVVTYSLGGNFLANISAADFQRLAGLQRLDLQYNRIGRLHPRAFERLARLEELYLGNNRLAALAPGTLRPLARLRVLYVNANRLGRLSAASFAGLGSLLKLRLDGNALGRLGDAAFSGLPNLLYLHLQANRIRRLSRGAFAGLAKLRFLDLSGNRQSALRQPAAFEPLRSLSTLLLAGNGLRRLGAGPFRHLPGLATLALSGNRLARLAPDAFSGLGALKELRLDGNRLRHLPAGLLEPLRSLEALDLSRNALAALPAAAFARLARLRELSLRDNALATLPGELLAASPALQRLELDGNAWSCDCRLRGLQRSLAAWRAQGRLLTVLVQCRRPPALAGQYLDALPDGAAAACPSPAPSAPPGGNSSRGARPAALLPTRAPAEPPPLVSDPCDFNKRFLRNLSVEAVGASSVSLRWAVRPHRSPHPLGPVRFRLLFDRFGAAVQFQRFVYLAERSQPAATLRELRPDTPYLVCLEAVLGGRVCPVAPRDHCAGLVTLPEEAAAGGSPDRQQLLTLVLLAVNALLLLAALAAWASRLLRRKVRGRRRAAPVHVRQMYSTRRPLRSTGTGVSADFSGFQSHRPPRGAALAACALGEADPIDFPCERFADGARRAGDRLLQQRFAE